MVAAGTVILSGCAFTLEPSAQQRQATERRTSEEAARKQAAAYRDLEEKLARLHLQGLEKDAEIRALNHKLEAAILEVVRAMAKLRGLSGRAEAASALAETEIALKSMPADVPRAQQLLRLATEEFRKQNYDGTVYLTSQVKLLISSRTERPVRGAEAARTDGEQALSPVLALRTSNRSNVREGPGPAFKILFVVERGTPLSAVSYNGVWVRVNTDDGRGGWVHYSLVDQR
jgi:hypothetical protein